MKNYWPGIEEEEKNPRAAVCSHSVKGRQANTSSRYAAALPRDVSRALCVSDYVRTFFSIDFRDGFSNPITHFAFHSGFVLPFPLLCPWEAAAFVNAPRVCPPGFVGCASSGAWDNIPGLSSWVGSRKLIEGTYAIFFPTATDVQQMADAREFSVLFFTLLLLVFQNKFLRNKYSQWRFEGF